MKFSTLLSFTLLTYGVIASPLTRRQVSSELLCNNGKLTQEKITEFKQLKATDPCVDGSIACIESEFAQCANSQWVLTQCGPTLECAVLPLLLKPGTSVTCDTSDDAATRLSNALANCSAPPAKSKDMSPTLTTDVATATISCPITTDSVAEPTGSPSNDIATIRKLNADDAEAQAKNFSSLTPDSPCKAGDMACIQGSFAQCVVQGDGSGKFVLTSCASPTTCVVLPLVLKRGTSITCDIEEDLVARLDQARKNL